MKKILSSFHIAPKNPPKSNDSSSLLSPPNSPTSRRAALKRSQSEGSHSPSSPPRPFHQRTLSSSGSPPVNLKASTYLPIGHSSPDPQDFQLHTQLNELSRLLKPLVFPNSQDHFPLSLQSHPLIQKFSLTPEFLAASPSDLISAFQDFLEKEFKNSPDSFSPYFDAIESHGSNHPLYRQYTRSITQTNTNIPSVLLSGMINGAPFLAYPILFSPSLSPSIILSALSDFQETLSSHSTSFDPPTNY